MKKVRFDHAPGDSTFATVAAYRAPCARSDADARGSGHAPRLLYRQTAGSVNTRPLRQGSDDVARRWDTGERNPYDACDPPHDDKSHYRVASGKCNRWRYLRHVLPMIGLRDRLAQSPEIWLGNLNLLRRAGHRHGVFAQLDIHTATLVPNASQRHWCRMILSCCQSSSVNRSELSPSGPSSFSKKTFASATSFACGSPSRSRMA